MDLERLWFAVILVAAGWDYEDVPFDEVMSRQRYKFLRDRLENAAKALRPEERRVAALRSKNHLGLPIAITVEDLALQPHYVKEMWQNAEPLYVSSTSAALMPDIKESK